MLSKCYSLVFDESLAKKMQKLILKEINKRTVAIEHVNPIAIVSILDPRFKKIHLNDAIACVNAVSKIKEFMKIDFQSVEMDLDSDKI